MKNLVTLLILVFGTVHSTQAQFEEVFASSKVTPQSSVSTSMNSNELSAHKGITESLVAVPKDIVNMTGKWYSKKNNCIVAMQWNGQNWVGTVLDISQSRRFQTGEIIIELFPNDTDHVYGRMKVIRNNKKFKWIEVNYKVRMTKLDGSNSWEFFGK